MMFTTRGITIDQVMEALNCSRSYVYKLIRRGELRVVEGSSPIRIETSSIISKIRRLFPWLVDSCLISLDYNLKRLEQQFG